MKLLLIALILSLFVACGDTQEPNLVTDPVNRLDYATLAPLTFIAPEGLKMVVKDPLDNVIAFDSVVFNDPELGEYWVIIDCGGEIVPDAGMGIRINESYSKDFRFNKEPVVWVVGPYKFIVKWYQYTAREKSGDIYNILSKSEATDEG